MSKVASNSSALLLYRKDIEVSAQSVLDFALKQTDNNRLTAKIVLWKAIELMAKEMDSMEQTNQQLVQPAQPKRKEKKNGKAK